MTLILGMSKPEGIYLSVDYRVTDLRTRALIDDAATKSLTIHYPPITQNGPKVLLGFTGVAQLRDGTPTMTWIRETLRGEVEVIDQSMAHLLSRLDRDIAPLRVPLTINVLVLEPGRRLFGGFTNVRGGKSPVARNFAYLMQEVDDAFMFANGSGAVQGVANGHIARLQPHLRVVPRLPMNHMKLLAIVNRRIAAKNASVSPFCNVSFINSDGRFEPVSRSFVEAGEAVPLEMSMLLGGIDLTAITERVIQTSQALRTGQPVPPEPDISMMNERLKRRS
jgi:hypothetical protein